MSDYENAAEVREAITGLEIAVTRAAKAIVRAIIHSAPHGFDSDTDKVANEIFEEEGL